MIRADLFPGSRDLIRLDRRTDRERSCCENLATIHVGKGPHGAELRCAGCGRHRGWLPQEFKKFIDELVRRFGAPVEPIILRDQTITIGHQQMRKSPKQFDKKDRGVLFKINRKVESSEQPDLFRRD